MSIIQTIGIVGTVVIVGSVLLMVAFWFISFVIVEHRHGSHDTLKAVIGINVLIGGAVFFALAAKGAFG